MFIFWTAAALVFLIIEIIDCGFGIIFLSIGSLIISILLNQNIIATDSYAVQSLIFSLSILVFAVIFFRNMKKSNDKSNNFEEVITGIVIDEDLHKGKEGKVRWSGTISIAIIDDGNSTEIIKVGENVKIKSFKGSVAVVEKI